MDNLFHEVRTFLSRTGMLKTKFGRLAVNDPNFVDRLPRTKPRETTKEKVRKFIREYES